MAALAELSDLELFLLTTPSDTEEAPWMVMADLQVRDIDVLKPILRQYIEQHRLPWYLASYLKIALRRPGSDELLEAAPDLLVAEAPDRMRTSWSIAAEGKAPLFVLEVASKDSLERDSKDKPKIYHAMGIAEYAIFAPERKRGPQLSGYRRDAAGRFVDWRPDRRGVLWSTSLGGLGFFVEERLWLRAVDVQGRRLPTPGELATDEAAARQASEAEVARLTEELRRLREEQRMSADSQADGG